MNIIVYANSLDVCTTWSEQLLENSEGHKGMAQLSGEGITTIEDFLDSARAFLDANAPLRQHRETVWGEGSDTVAALAEKSPESQAKELRAAKEWKAVEFDAGFGWLTGPIEFGGAGLTNDFQRAYNGIKSEYETASEAPFRVGLGMVAPTIQQSAEPHIRDQYLRKLHRGEVIACQLFSEPNAGSDLAAVQTQAIRDGDDWIVDGQKVWTSGAHYSDIGLLLCRTDRDVPKHQGITAFVVDMRTPGVEVRPLRQMTGAASFNEVFLTGVRIPDTHRIGAPGDGWKVAMATLANERAAMGNLAIEPGAIDVSARLVELSCWLGSNDDPLARQAIADVFVRLTVARQNQSRAGASIIAGKTAGPEMSIGKLVLAENQRRVSDAATAVLGNRIAADTGEWGTFAWSQFVLGSFGAAIGGGTDQIMKNIVSERVLGLPKESR